MKTIIAAVLVLAVVAVNGGVLTTQEVHGVALHAPIVHAAPAPLLVHTSSSSSYKVRAPAAKLVATAPLVHAPVVASSYSLPLVHARPHSVILH